MDLVALKSELTADPLARGYAQMTDAQVAADLNTAARDVSAVVTVRQVRQYLVGQINGTGANQRFVLDMIREFAEAGTIRGVAPVSVTVVPARRSSAQMLWFMLRYAADDGEFEVNNANIQAGFTSLGPNGGSGPSILTAAQLTAIAALAAKSVVRRTELGLPPIGAHHVEQARAS